MNYNPSAPSLFYFYFHLYKCYLQVALDAFAEVLVTNFGLANDEDGSRGVLGLADLGVVVPFRAVAEVAPEEEEEEEEVVLIGGTGGLAVVVDVKVPLLAGGEIPARRGEINPPFDDTASLLLSFNEIPPTKLVTLLTLLLLFVLLLLLLLLDDDDVDELLPLFGDLDLFGGGLGISFLDDPSFPSTGGKLSTLSTPKNQFAGLVSLPRYIDSALSHSVWTNAI
jgi:hypothetical protein